MALDYGERRIGVAISDPTRTLAQPLETVTGSPRAALERIARLVVEHEVDRIVVGLPLLLDGTAGAQARLARSFGERVERETGVAVEFVDERLSSAEARRVLRDAGVSSRKQRGRTDPIAAALMLRTWLERAAGP